MPVRKDDEVIVKSGHFKGREGKVVEIYRKKWAVYIDKVQREKANGIIPLNHTLSPPLASILFYFIFFIPFKQNLK